MPQDQSEKVLFEGRPATIGSFTMLLLVIITLGIAAFFLWLKAKGTRYKITTERIVIETGLFSKKLEQIDLYRIQDYITERPFGQRIMKTGNLIIKSLDKTTPDVQLRELRVDVVDLYENLRKATEADKRRRGVRLVDFE